MDSGGLSVGLALYWHESCTVDILDKDDRYIDVAVKISDSNEQWRLTCVYGEPRVENRHLMWTKLQNLSTVSDLLWLVIGDFNEAMWDFEHFSVTPRPEGQMVAFRDALEICGLVDLGFSGVPHTYDNLRGGNANVKVRLDRAVASNDWRNLYAFHSVQHLITPCSDHVPLLLRGEPETSFARPNCRQYEIHWERDAALPDIIRQAWESFGSVNNLAQLHVALDRTMSTLRTWSKKNHGNITKELEKSRAQLEQLMNMNADRQEIRKVTDRMNELLYREEMMWLQRSRVSWFKEGDRNTKYFQNKTVWRARKKNS